MRISLNWLKKYININILPEELANRLTMVGLEVESVEYLGDKFKNFVVGEVVEVNKHPKADKLTVCKVNIGSKIIQVICGAPNVVVKQKVPVGLVGAMVPRNQHDPDGQPFELAQVKIRGVESFGMICSEYELAIGDDKEGIMVLSEDAVVGNHLADYFGANDVIFEIGITPNRPDAMSYIGVAREVGALLDERLNIPSIKLVESKRKITDYATVKIEDTINCPRYTARVVLNVKIGKSPKWLQDSLTSVGLRPVNNIVDIANYVLMECGHPLHAFDYDKLAEHTIVVKKAKSGESFTTLDHKDRVLKDETLMICDGKQSVAIAGVIGGENSEISDVTRNVLIESAYFDPRNIRRTSKYLGISTDASQRFERGADPNITRWAVDRAAQLMYEICGGEILNGSIDIYPTKISENEIELRVDKTNEILGVNLTKENISELLKKLNFEIIPMHQNIAKEKTIKVKVPSFRPDIEREIDLIEEVARVFGYDNINVKTVSNLKYYETAPQKDYIDFFRQQLISLGFMEVVTNSMQNISIASIASDSFVKIANPISKDMEALRTSMVPSLLEIVRNNIFHNIKDLRLFEIGNVYFHNILSHKSQLIKGYTEESRIILVLTGVAQLQSWTEKPRNIDIFDVKGEVQTLFQKILLDNIKFIPYSTTNALTEQGLSIEINSECIGTFGKISKDVISSFDIEQDVYVVELNTEIIEKYRKKSKSFIGLPKYPSVLRDIAIEIDDSITNEIIEKEIRTVCGTLLSKISLFDVYIGEQIRSGKKSCAYALEFNAVDHTMTQEEIDHLMQKIIQNLENNLQASIRK